MNHRDDVSPHFHLPPLSTSACKRDIAVPSNTTSRPPSSGQEEVRQALRVGKGGRGARGSDSSVQEWGSGSASDAQCLMNLRYLRAQQLDVVLQFHADAGVAAGVVRQAVQVVA